MSHSLMAASIFGLGGLLDAVHSPASAGIRQGTNSTMASYVGKSDPSHDSYCYDFFALPQIFFCEKHFCMALPAIVNGFDS